MWATMVTAHAELAGEEPPSDDAVALDFMGSGASVRVQFGELKKLANGAIDLAAELELAEERIESLKKDLQAARRSLHLSDLTVEKLRQERDFYRSQIEAVPTVSNPSECQHRWVYTTGGTMCQHCGSVYTE